MLPEAAPAFPAQIGKIRKALTDDENVRRARVALRELLGRTIRLGATLTRKYLIADVSHRRKANWRPLALDFGMVAGACVATMRALRPNGRIWTAHARSLTLADGIACRHPSRWARAGALTAMERGAAW